MSQVQPTVTDEKTVNYFEEYTPEYSPFRLRYALSILSGLGSEHSSLIDIGCGVGNILQVIKDKTPIRDLWGLDVSGNNLAIVRRATGCETVHGSIMDGGVVESINRTFDFAILGAVLHHLVGRSRAESKRYALQAVLNALKLLRDGGHLIIIEPVFSPSATMDVIFHVKRILSGLTNRRIQILGSWNNIGAPVVSYFTEGEVVSMLSGVGGCAVIATDIRPAKLNLLWRLALITKRADMTIVVQKSMLSTSAGKGEKVEGGAL